MWKVQTLNWTKKPMVACVPKNIWFKVSKLILDQIDTINFKEKEVSKLHREFIIWISGFKKKLFTKNQKKNQSKQ